MSWHVLNIGNTDATILNYNNNSKNQLFGREATKEKGSANKRCNYCNREITRH